MNHGRGDPAEPANSGPGILYIGGAWRSGSTLLMRLLSTGSDVVPVGELFDIWNTGFLQNQLCTCGSPFLECPFWTEVVRVAFGRLTTSEARSLDELRLSVERGPYLPMLVTGRLRTPHYRGRLSEYANVCTQFYSAVRSVSGTHTVIDSSKSAAHLLVLALGEPSIPRVVHLVRDSRAVTYSWTRRVVKPETGGDAKLMANLGAARSSAEWIFHNASVDLLRLCRVPVLTVAYERLVSDYQSTLEEVLRFSGGRSVGDPIDGDRLSLPEAHIMGASPRLFQTTHLSLRPDDEWKTSLPPTKRFVTTALTLPFLFAYGYLGAAQGRHAQVERETAD